MESKDVKNNTTEFIEDTQLPKLIKQTDEENNWENDIYGFECANWTCKC